MRKPTRTQRFFASDWPRKAWLVLLPSACVVAVLFLLPPQSDALLNWRFVLWLVLSVLAAAAAGFCAAILLGWILLGPVYAERERANGGPFEPGDRVQILAGPHRDKIVHVREKWQGNQVRVDLGERDDERFTEVFSPWQLLREQGSGSDPR
ncbi:MAG: KOW motif-containing protein [Phycisphaerae bacterium]